MKTWVILGNGYVGSAFSNAGFPFIGKEKFVYNGGNFDQLIALPEFQAANVVVNTIGHTDTKWTEKEENFNLTWMVNAEFVQKLSNYCEANYKKLVQLSTGDLYGNNFSLEENIESSKKIDVGTIYRFTKYAAEKFCHGDDLILRLRLPFDERNHPKNLLVKAVNYEKFYVYCNDYTYIPDLINATKVLVEGDRSGTFNVVSHEDGCILYLLRNILGLQKFQKYDLHNNKADPAFIQDLNEYHIHNICNDSKLRQYFIQTPLESAVKTSWENLKNLLPVS